MSTELQKPFQANLNREMARLGWAWQHLVAALHDLGVEVSQSTVERWISGDNEPRAALITTIAKALKCSTDALLDVPDEHALPEPS